MTLRTRLAEIVQHLERMTAADYDRLVIAEEIACAELLARPTDAAYDAAVVAMMTRRCYALLVFGVDPDDVEDDDATSNGDHETKS